MAARGGADGILGAPAKVVKHASSQLLGATARPAENPLWFKVKFARIFEPGRVLKEEEHE